MKKTISKVLVVTMVASCMLTGCGKSDKEDASVTAEDLLNGVKETAEKGGEYYDMDVDLDISGQVDSALLMGTSSDEVSLVTVALSGALNVKFDEDTEAVDGSVTINLMGMEIPQDVKTWTQDNGDGTQTEYSYDSDEAKWYYTISDVEESSDEESEVADVQDIIDSIKDCTVESTSDGYEITGTLDLDKLVEKAKESESAEDIDFDSYKDYIDMFNVNVSVGFDSDKNLQTITLTADKIEQEQYTLDTCVIKITVNSLAGSEALEVPSDVTDNAEKEE